MLKKVGMVKGKSKIVVALVCVISCMLLLAGCSGVSGTSGKSVGSGSTLDLASIPEYSDEPYVEINGNVPEFTEEEMATEPGTEEYGELDSLGRCTVAFANVGTETMPTEKRGDISQIHPTGWKQNFYDFVDQEALYNRSHLIGYQLTGENANERNLITGTRYMNSETMEPFESQVAQYVKRTGNHVIYRVTPIFEDDNLLASGVQMEAKSVEDDGAGICFNVYCYNVEPGVGIDYATGDNWAEQGGKSNVSSSASSSSNSYAKSSSSSNSSTNARTSSSSSAKSSSSNNGSETAATYVLNTSSMKFHLPSCQGARNMSTSNKKTVKTTRSSLIQQGYEPCGSCNP